MRRVICATLAVLLCLQTAFAAPQAVDLVFAPEGGGTFLYCNNNESIRREHLSDTSNQNPEYQMNNEELGEGAYALYYSHLNHTELRNSSGTVVEAGFAIECDVQFIARKDTTFTITALGFEVPEVEPYFQNGMMVKEEQPWGCINAIADYMQMPIHELHSGKIYRPLAFSPVTVTLKKGEEVWLSRYIENYRAVPWQKPVHILADFTVEEGCVDVNMAALRSNGTLRDRSHHSPKAAYGRYHRDRQYKGRADTLPYMRAEEMAYTIGEDFISGTLLAVTVYNSYMPEGNTLNKWFTHLNPMEDIWSRTLCAESDMLALTYPDDSKLSYYGAGVRKTERDNVWRFDVYHSDTRQYEESFGGNKRSYSPNYELTTQVENSGKGCNLGNYGVYLHYPLALTNDTDKTKYFYYQLRTTSNNIVGVLDEEGNYLSPGLIAKGGSSEKRTDVMACVELAPKATTRFTVEVLLPMNYPGGMENSFTVADVPDGTVFSPRSEEPYLLKDHFTGKEYYRWEDGDLLVSQNRKDWEPQNLTEASRAVFRGNWENYEIVRAGDGYMARCGEYQSSPSYYTSILKYYHSVYFLDNDFEVTAQYTFDAYPTEISYAGGWYYVRAGKSYCSKDGFRWEPFDSSYTLPAECGSGAVCVKDGEFYLCEEGNKMVKLVYETNKPLYIDGVGDLFYYAHKENLFLSEDGMYWDMQTFSREIESLDLIDGAILINGEEKAKAPTFNRPITLRLDDEILLTERAAVTENGRTLAPIRLLFEKLGARVAWEEETKTVTVRYGEDTFRFPVDSAEAEWNGEKVVLDAPVRQLYDYTVIPVRFLMEAIGCEVVWQEDTRTVYITTPKKEISPEEGLPEDGVIPDEETALSVAKILLARFHGAEISPLKAELLEDVWSVTNEGGETLLCLRKTDGAVLFIK